MHYRQIRALSGRGSDSHQFTNALRAVVADGDGSLFLAGDSEIKVFGGEGRLQRRWPTARPGYGLAVSADGRVWVGEAGQVEIFSATGELLDTWRDSERLGLVTAVGLHGDDVYCADAHARWIRRYDMRGGLRNNIGDRHRKGGFHIPNGRVDFAVDSGGVVHVANPGMHRVERYKPDGELLGHFGRFGNVDPEGFPGCCNPTNLALGPAGEVVVTEKAGPRVKVYDDAGQLVTVVAGGDTFDPGAKNMDVAVDSSGRIAVADPVRLQVLVFATAGVAKPVNEEVSV